MDAFGFLFFFIAMTKYLYKEIQERIQVGREGDISWDALSLSLPLLRDGDVNGGHE
jgi:hypothetical protein